MGTIIKFTMREGAKMSKRITPEYVYDIRQKRYTTDNAVEKIFKECDINEYPINVFQIADKLNFDIMYGRFKLGNVYGAIWDGKTELTVGNKKSKRFILVNADDSKERQLFTIAHELGHFMLHCTDDVNFFERYHGGAEQSEEAKDIENEADYFAASLLMPTREFKKYVDRNRNLDKQELLTHICRDFWVEEEAVSRRFRELKIEI